MNFGIVYLLLDSNDLEKTLLRQFTCFGFEESFKNLSSPKAFVVPVAFQCLEKGEDTS